MIFWARAWLALMLFLVPIAALAEARPEVPANLAGIITVGADQVLALLDSGQAVIIDTRKPSDTILGSIPEAIRCPTSSGHHALDDAEIAQAVNDFQGCAEVMATESSRPVVVFCNGPHCWRSPKAAIALKKIGFTRIYWYRMGMNDWKAQGLPLE